MFKAFLVILILIGVGLVLFGPRVLPGREIVTDETDTATSSGAPVTATSSVKTYANSELGIDFTYPSYYFLEEKDLGNAERGHHALVLTEDTEENRAVREGRAPGREGPVAITFDFYQNDLDQQTALDWVKNTNASNFKLGSGEYTTSALGGKEAIAYQWSGLYEGDSLVLDHKDNILMASVTFLTQDDRIRGDFYDLIETVQLE